MLKSYNERVSLYKKVFGGYEGEEVIADLKRKALSLRIEVKAIDPNLAVYKEGMIALVRYIEDTLNKKINDNN